MPELPKFIREIGFDFEWDNQKVWALSVAVEEAPRSELEWYFDYPWLCSIAESGVFDLKPREFLKHLEDYPREFERMKNASLEYPIDTMLWKNRLLILDGLHRLMKATWLGIDPIQLRRIPPEFKDRILKDK